MEMESIQSATEQITEGLDRVLNLTETVETTNNPDIVSDSSGNQIYLPREIVDEILSRLPIKSLLRFKTVAKSWNNTISTKEFVKAHLKNSTMNMILANPR